MANRVGKKIFPRGSRRQPMLQVGDLTPLGYIWKVRKQTAKYARHYQLNDLKWYRRDELGV